jgi:hypothetical protein
MWSVAEIWLPAGSYMVVATLDSQSLSSDDIMMCELILTRGDKGEGYVYHQQAYATNAQQILPMMLTVTASTSAGGRPVLSCIANEPRSNVSEIRITATSVGRIIVRHRSPDM